MSNRFKPGTPARKFIREIDSQTAIEDAVKAALVEYDAAHDDVYDLRRAASDELDELIADDGVEISDLYYHNRDELYFRCRLKADSKLGPFLRGDYPTRNADSDEMRFCG